MSHPVKVDGETHLKLGYIDEGDGTTFFVRHPHHDIIIGHRSKDYYGDIADAKRIIDEINTRLDKHGVGYCQKCRLPTLVRCRACWTKIIKSTSVKSVTLREVVWDKINSVLKIFGKQMVVTSFIKDMQITLVRLIVLEIKNEKLGVVTDVDGRTWWYDSKHHQWIDVTMPEKLKGMKLVKLR